jgi:fatty acid desaturase
VNFAEKTSNALDRYWNGCQQQKVIYIAFRKLQIGGCKMDNHKKKMAAPILITILIVLYYFVYFSLIVSFFSGVLKVLLGLIPLAFAGVMICVCVQRINEIRGGEEDDLSKY